MYRMLLKKYFLLWLWERNMASKVQLSRTVQYRWKMIKNRPLGTINRLVKITEIMGNQIRDFDS